MSKKKNNFYVVREGSKRGIFDNREDCLESVKGYPNAKYMGFVYIEDAQKALSKDYLTFLSNKNNILQESNIFFDRNSIAVDAACSGNPGFMEYRGIDLISGQEIFHQKFDIGTNNIGEFLAIVHGLSYLKNEKSNKSIYTDSKIAINRIHLKKCKTNIVLNNKLLNIIKNAEHRLNKNVYINKILKRQTKDRGEIPADFGRK